MTQDNSASWVSAIATVVIAALTIVLAKETWALRKIQLSQIEQIRKDSIKPNVALLFKSSPVSMNLFNVEILNNGPGTALDITFSFANETPENEDIFEFLCQRIKDIAMINDGISSLNPIEKRSSYIFNFIDLNKLFKDRTLSLIVRVTINYSDTENKPFTITSFLNFNEYKGITEVGGGDPLYKISKSLDSLQKDVKSLVQGSKKIKTDIYTSEDRTEERDKWEQLRANEEHQKSSVTAP